MRPHYRSAFIRGLLRWRVQQAALARRRAETALVAVIEEAYIQGVSTRSVDKLSKAMGMTGIPKSQLSRLCFEIDERVTHY